MRSIFQGLGYRTRLQEIPIVRISPDSGLRVLSPEVRDAGATPLHGSGVGGATSLLVDAGLARVEDLGGVALRGRVALIDQSEIFFQIKADNMAAAGAVAAVVYNDGPDTQRALDNASGTAAVLALAGKLAGRRFPFTQRFIGFGGEELGLLGSRRYVDSLNGEELGSIVAMLNLDMLAGSGPLGVGGTAIWRLGSRPSAPGWLPRHFLGASPAITSRSTRRVCPPSS